MGIIWDVTRWIKSAANTVKNAFTNDDKPSAVEKPQTLNQQIETNKIWQRMPTSNVGSFPITSNIQNLNIAPQDNNVPRINFSIGNKDSSLGVEEDDVSLADRITNNVWKTAINVANKISDFWWDVQDVWEDFSTWALSKRYNRDNAEAKTRAEKDYKKEVEENTKHLILKAYDAPMNGSRWRTLELKPKDEWLWNTQKNRLFSQYNNAETDEDAMRILREAYNDSIENWQAAPRYAEDNYTDEERNTLKNNNIETTWDWGYKPTFDEWLQYIDMEADNERMPEDIKKKYAYYLWSVDEPQSEDLINEQEKFVNLAKTWIEEKIDNRLSSRERSEWINNTNDIVSYVWNRVWVVEENLNKLYKDAMQTPELQRNDAERYIIEVYNNDWARAKTKLAENVNDYLSRQLDEWVNSKWQIEDAIWKFSDGKWVNEILTDWLWDILWIDVEWPQVFWKVSFVDLINRFGNEAAYKYTQWTQDNLIYRWWNWFEHELEPVWEQRWEAGQAVLWRLPTKLVNTVASAFQWRWWRNSPTAAYLDADFSVWKLIETDDSHVKRTIKKYALQFWEYAPEWIGAVAPDILLTIATSWWSAPSILRSVWRIWKFRRWRRAENFIENARKVNNALDKTITWFERVWEIWRELWNIDNKRKRLGNIVDRSLSQFAVWQSLDAKLSAYDTEPYSLNSFLISVFWSVLWDILPEAKDIWGMMRTWAKWWHAWTKWTWVWDLVDFISESDENADAIARAMWKRKATFTEQELKDYVRTFAEVTDAAKSAFNKLNAEWKSIANQWTKELMYNYVKQNYWANSTVWRAVRELLTNKSTTPADIIKYTWNIPGEVSVWPFKSSIELTHGTRADVVAKWWWLYDVELDAINGWFGDKVSQWFTLEDIQALSKIKNYEDVFKDRDNLFREVTIKNNNWNDETLWYLTEDGLDRFWLEARWLTADSFWIEISSAENVREILKERMAWLERNNLSEDTINKLADWWWYDEVVNDISNVLC